MHQTFTKVKLYLQMIVFLNGTIMLLASASLSTESRLAKKKKKSDLSGRKWSCFALLQGRDAHFTCVMTLTDLAVPPYSAVRSQQA